MEIIRGTTRKLSMKLALGKKQIFFYVLAFVLALVVVNILVRHQGGQPTGFISSGSKGDIVTRTGTTNVLPTVTPIVRSTSTTVESKSTTLKPKKNKEDFLKYFRWSMTPIQTQKMISLLSVFIQQLEKYNVTYIAYAGTLIGIDRHHGTIPWDDDIDMAIPTEQKKRMIAAMEEMSPKYKLFQHKGNITGKWKFFNVEDQPIEGKKFRYPYIDIFFIREHSKEKMYVELSPNEPFRKIDMYPLIRRFFHGLLIYTPCNISSFIKTIIAPDYPETCVSASFNHSQEHSIYSVRKVNCVVLKNMVPFVERTYKNYSNKISTKEILIKNKTIIQIVQYSIPRKCNDVPSTFPSDLETHTFYN